MQKQQKYHHSITENGNLQLRIITEYVKDGKVSDKKYSHPVTPADTKDMAGWDDRSKDIVTTITNRKVITDFDAEFWGIHGELNPLEALVEIITFDRVIEEDGKIAVRRITRIFDEGIEVSKKYHRSWIMPGDNSSANDVISKAVAEKLCTPEVIAAYKTKVALSNEIGSIHPAIIFMTPSLVVAITFALLNIL